jgi:hypothetical protein
MSEVITAPAPAPVEAPAPAAPAPAPAAPAPAPTSALGGSPSPAPSPAPTPAEEFKFADKVVVKNGEAIDWEATARNSEKGRQHLETRLGSGDAPPATVGDYKLNLPEELKEKIDAEDLAKSEDFKAMQKSMHSLGLNQKQMDGVVAELLSQGMKMRAEAPLMAEAECVATLRKVEGWQTEEQYGKQIGSADRQASPEAMAQIQETVDQLMTHTSYLNPNHPQHADTVAKVNALTAKQVGTRNVGTGKTITFKT